MSLRFGCLLCALACTSGDGKDLIDGPYAPGEGPIPELSISCTTDRSTAGVSGTSSVDAITVAWSHDPVADMSWAGPVVFELADDTIGVAVVVDGGSASTGIGWATLDGQVLLDWTGDWQLGDRPSTARRGGADTADSAHTGDTGSSWSPSTGQGWGVAPFSHWPEVGGTVVMPINLDTRPSSGCLSAVVVADGDREGETGVIHVATKRSEAVGSLIDLNFIVVDGAGVSDEELRAASNRMHSLYSGGGAPQLGPVTQYSIELPGGAYTPVSGPDIEALRAVEPGGSERAMNVFFIADFIGESGTLGFAAGIPGPIGVHGTGSSGVTLAIDPHRDRDGGLDTTLLGETMAHEVGHQLGLFHTTESEPGSWDPIADTPACQASADTDGDGSLSAEECVDRDGYNVMFWTSGDGPQTELSATQALVLSSSPIAYRPEESR